MPDGYLLPIANKDPILRTAGMVDSENLEHGKGMVCAGCSSFRGFGGGYDDGRVPNFWLLRQVQQVLQRRIAEVSDSRIRSLSWATVNNFGQPRLSLWVLA